MITSNKDLKKVIKEAESIGWQFKLTKGNHIKAMHPEGGLAIISRSPSDWRAMTKIKFDLRLK